MTSRSLGPTLIAIGFGIIVVPFLAVFLIALGPPGWVAVGGVIIVIGIAVSLKESSSYEAVDHRERTNCDACGARVDTDADACHHCGADR